MSRATTADHVAVGAATPADAGASAGRSVRAHGRARSGILALLAALALILGVGAGAAAVESTSAAWTDPVRAAATVSAGQWQTLGCVAMNADGSTKKDGRCAVTAVVFDQWGNESLNHRNYYVTVASNAGAGYVVVTVDLAAGQMRSNEGTGTWTWGKAATTGGHLTPSSACSELPLLTARTPAGWGASGEFYLSMVDDRYAPYSSPATCR